MIQAHRNAESMARASGGAESMARASGGEGLMAQGYSAAMSAPTHHYRADRPAHHHATGRPARFWPDAERIALTPAGRASMERELRRLREERIPALVAQFVAARDDPATRTDGADLLEIQQEQQRVERRVAELEWLLSRAREVAPPRVGVIALGSSVEVEDEDEGERVSFQLVDPREADAAEGRLSTGSPVGRALLGRRAGDAFVVEVPGGRRRVHVVAVL